MSSESTRPVVERPIGSPNANRTRGMNERKDDIHKKASLSEPAGGTPDPSEQDYHNAVHRTSKGPGGQIRRRIHILGTGSVGKLIAHSLRGLPNPPPVTLLFHRASYYYEWQASKKDIKITTNGITVSHSGFGAEPARCGWRRYGKSLTIEQFFADEAPYNLHDDSFQEAPFPDQNLPDPIQNLIVTVKAASTVNALLAIRPRLSKNSSILFLQNGMGIIEKVNKDVFADPTTRPNYMLGIISHGVSPSTEGRFAATHAGMGTIALGLIPREEDGMERWSTASRYILRTVCRVPVLAAVPAAPVELMQAQLEKLAINAVINPITALVDARNGAILYTNPLTRVIRLLLAEISLVILAMPELKSLPNVATRFSTKRLEALVTAVAYKTGNNVSSMLGDVREGRRTEIEFINGYIVQRGEELGITCFMNYMMVQLIKGKQQIVDKERSEELPLAKVKPSQKII
ncbi:hypothetical protein EJ08DRAFT_692192 [Tothia fuscella]|uniref:2-dehydropantoate 2-reductase n=1 Tax=Tothia fuscella TaxID=1048955 RepID=A0A9P4P2A2_9PEZI|nr:hypothetical protein EJ08DRAFT_692192 [Tothia fuscella]